MILHVAFVSSIFMTEQPILSTIEIKNKFKVMFKVNPQNPYPFPDEFQTL